jgi:chemotaxis protein MotB
VSQHNKSSQEILIIRRSGGDEAPHKGGAWKIAYADFVTAMMAFFLVMWLINSANEVTKARVASYFNPIKMTDAAPLRRGLKETIDAQSPNAQAELTETQEGQTKEKLQAKTAPSAVRALSDSELLLNPYSALDELVKRSGDPSLTGLVEESEAEIGDPFNPRAYKRYQSESSKQVSEVHETEKPAQPETGQSEKVNSQKNAASDPASTVKKGEETESDPKEATSPGSLKLADELRKQVEMKVATFKDRIDLAVRVEVTDEGVLLVLEDGSKKSMFAIGSAQPNPALIEIIGGIGALLSDREGFVVVRGHTDGRQFRNRKYDNWQLSTDRAHMASYMLIRGGLPEARIKRIEGYGSSKPILENDLMLDANRRVEFLVTK